MITVQLIRLEAYLRTGGPVMWPLLILSLLMWVLIVDRALYLRRLHHRDLDNQGAWQHVQQHQPPAGAGAVARLVACFLEKRSGNVQLDRCILDELVFSSNRRVGRYLALIGILATIAPLLGLLGTVTGMMTTFDILSTFGTGNARGMAAGISEALITTETGLIIAIPGLYMKTFLERRAQELRRRTAGAGYFLRRQLKEASC